MSERVDNRRSSGSPLPGESQRPARRFRVADWTIEPVTNRIERAGRVVRLEPKVMDVLVLLADRVGQVVTREELERCIWAGTVVGYDTVTGAIQKARKGLGDDPHRPHIIETIPKRGYRLIASVSESPSPTAPEPLGAEPLLRARWRVRPGRRALFLLLSCLVAVGLTGFWYALVKGPSTLVAPAVPAPSWPTNASGPSLAVLPFVNLSGDPEQDYFSDGLTDDLITDLSKVTGLSVAGRHSAFAYKGSSTSAADVGRGLGVRYVLLGSMRREGDRLRINAQLVDATTGYNLWADRFEGDMADVFTFRDQITRDAASVLKIRLEDIGRPAPGDGHTPNAHAYDLYLRGQAALAHLSRQNLLAARALFEQAVRADPSFARTYAALANTHSIEVSHWWSEDRNVSLGRARKLALRAVELDDSLPQAHYALARAYREAGDLDHAAEEANQLISLDPVYADGYIIYASILSYAGMPKESLHLFRSATRLDLPQTARYLFHRGQTFFTLEDFPEAIRLFEEGLEQDSHSERLRVWLAAAYAKTGRLHDAEWLITELLMSRPDMSVSRVAAATPYQHKSDLDRLVQGLRTAGLPE